MFPHVTPCKVICRDIMSHHDISYHIYSCHTILSKRECNAPSSSRLYVAPIAIVLLSLSVFEAHYAALRFTDFIEYLLYFNHSFTVIEFMIFRPVVRKLMDPITIYLRALRLPLPSSLSLSATMLLRLITESKRTASARVTVR